MSHQRKYRKLGSIPFSGLFFSMTLALLILGIFGLLVILATNLTHKIQQSIEVQVFLQKNISQNKITAIRNTLGEMGFVAKENGQPRISFISKKEAADTFSKELGEDFVKYIGDNPLSDLLIVQIDKNHQSPAQLKSIQAKIESLREVLEVTYVEKVVKSIHQNTTRLSTILLSLMVLLFVAVIMIIYTSIRLSIFSQRFLIRSMQLVGATGSFIQRPFLLRAIFYAFLSAEVACTALYALVKLGERQIPQLDILKQHNQLILLAVIIFSVGMMTSYLSTRGAIARYLRMSLDDLY